MRLEITLNGLEKIILPFSYNHLLQGLIYTLLSPSLRKFLHNHGFTYEKRRFKLFCFSRLLGNFEVKDGALLFNPPVRFYLSSPKKEIIESLAEGLLKKENLFLGKNEIFIETISVLPKPLFEKEIIIKMLSPITIYSTLNKADGTKKTYYYSPFEEDFNRLIKENLKKKYFAVFNEELKKIDFKITPYKVSSSDEKVILYKKSDAKQTKPTVIKGWMGLYRLEADPKSAELSYNCGLGAKNSLGFGMWERIKYWKHTSNKL
ncbi:MAG: CRISPR-associated endoribonuclease Cas6 [Candidatus Omnitrophica bacterium]|nr:CRISPR-associated endoribonuclease Cas6 [Candidatus Omnitrophota bacterium]